MADQTFSIIFQGLKIGADDDGGGTLDVITDSKMTTWSVNPTTGLILNGEWYCGVEGDNVVVRKTPQPGITWVFVQAGVKRESVISGVYQIELAGGKSWSTQPTPKSPVILGQAQDFEVVMNK